MVRPKEKKFDWRKQQVKMQKPKGAKFTCTSHEEWASYGCREKPRGGRGTCRVWLGRTPWPWGWWVSTSHLKRGIPLFNYFYYFFFYFVIIIIYYMANKQKVERDAILKVGKREHVGQLSRTRGDNSIIIRHLVYHFQCAWPHFYLLIYSIIISWSSPFTKRHRLCSACDHCLRFWS